MLLIGRKRSDLARSLSVIGTRRRARAKSRRYALPRLSEGHTTSSRRSGRSVRRSPLRPACWGSFHIGGLDRSARSAYPIRFSGYQDTGDPSIAFDAQGTAYLTTLANGGNNTPDVVVASSSDGGRTWSTPVVVAAGKGSVSGRSVFHDHPVLAAWGDGNVIVTWIKYVFGNQAASLVTCRWWTR